MGKERNAKRVKQAVRKIFGDKIYRDIHAIRAFQPISEPFPSQATPSESVDWSRLIPQSMREGLPSFTYIVSPMQRSGTNFLNYMLGNHPGLEVPVGKGWPEEQCLYSAAPELVSYVSQTVGYWTNWIPEEGDRQLHAKKMLASLGTAQLQHFQKEDTCMQLLKTPDSGNVEWIYHMFPNVKVIALVRDGRDSVTSYIQSWGSKSIFRRLCKRWDFRMNELFKLEEFVAANGLEDQYCLVKYEDLVKDSTSELKRIFSYLGLSADDYPWESLDSVPVLGSSSFKKNDKVHWKPVKKPKAFDPTGKWHDWGEYEKTIFKRYAGATLIRLGYAEDEAW